tara:strand:- start:6722 stop:7117 length:396 start_codon:yes stop_codon:yes gene_type:complete
MEETFNFEIISPEKVIFSENVAMVTLPSYEGDMSVLKNHISIITFLRPGIVKAQKNDGSFDEFLTFDGTVEYYNDSLVLLSSSAINIKNISKEFIENLNKDAQSKLSEKQITDHDRYVLNHKLDVLKGIRI